MIESDHRASRHAAGLPVQPSEGGQHWWVAFEAAFAASLSPFTGVREVRFASRLGPPGGTMGYTVRRATLTPDMSVEALMASLAAGEAADDRAGNVADRPLLVTEGAAATLTAYPSAAAVISVVPVGASLEIEVAPGAESRLPWSAVVDHALGILESGILLDPTAGVDELRRISQAELARVIEVGGRLPSNTASTP